MPSLSLSRANLATTASWAGSRSICPAATSAAYRAEVVLAICTSTWHERLARKVGTKAMSRARYRYGGRTATGFLQSARLITIGFAASQQMVLATARRWDSIKQPAAEFSPKVRKLMPQVDIP